jgi:hypothetical protein
LGIANVKHGTSGAEIGGAFGGEKKQWRRDQDLMLGKYTCDVKLIQSTTTCHLF